MKYYYDSPVGRLIIGLEPDGAVSYLKTAGEAELPLPDGAVKCWLNSYFSGEKPEIIPVAAKGTETDRRIWSLISEIPYGETAGYGELARRYSEKYGARLSPRNVGSACGRNPVWIIVPCHRVIMSTGALGGYAGGAEMKKKLLELEKH